jgi:hypothetical protein
MSKHIDVQAHTALQCRLKLTMMTLVKFENKKPKPRTHAMSMHMEMQIEKKNTLKHYLGGLT